VNAPGLLTATTSSVRYADEGPLAVDSRMNATKDFRQCFTASRRVPSRSFEKALFFECAPLHVLAVTLFCDSAKLALLTPDRELIVRIGTMYRVEDVERATNEYCGQLAHDRWLRRVGLFRISTRKLKRIAQSCLEPSLTAR
jgi:hypothetical protein